MTLNEVLLMYKDRYVKAVTRDKEYLVDTCEMTVRQIDPSGLGETIDFKEVRDSITKVYRFPNQGAVVSFSIFEDRIERKFESIDTETNRIWYTLERPGTGVTLRYSINPYRLNIPESNLFWDKAFVSDNDLKDYKDLFEPPLLGTQGEMDVSIQPSKFESDNDLEEYKIKRIKYD